MIRKAEVNDKIKVSELYYVSGPNICKYCFASDEKTTLGLIKMLYGKPENPFSREYYWIYEDDGVIKGMLVGFPGMDMHQLEKNISHYGKEMFKIAGFRACMQMMAHELSLHNYMPPIKDDEFYIQSLAVFPEFRGQKISSALVKCIKEYAHSKEFAKLSLVAESDNRHAIKVYEKFGFVCADETILPRKFHKKHLSGFCKMVLRI